MTTIERARPAVSATARPRQVVVATDRLLAAARFALAEAEAADDAGERYAGAHLAALRVGAALLADRARPEPGRPSRRRPTSVWTLLTRVAPEFSEWAAFFAAGADKRAAAQAGLRGAVTAREADDLLHDAATFLALVESGLGLLPLGGGVEPGPVESSRVESSRVESGSVGSGRVESGSVGSGRVYPGGTSRATAASWLREAIP